MEWFFGKPFGVWCSDWKVPAATGKLQDIRNSWTSWTSWQLGIRYDVSTRCQDTACSCLLQKVSYFLVFVCWASRQSLNHLRQQMKKDKESRFESTLPNWSRLPGWDLDIGRNESFNSPPGGRHICAFPSGLEAAPARMAQNAEFLPSNGSLQKFENGDWFFLENDRISITSELISLMFFVSTFGFKVDDLHGGDFFRDIGGRHVSRVINSFSGSKRLFFAGFQPEGVASSDNTFWLTGW